MKDDLRFTPAACLGTFRFPATSQTDNATAATGQVCYDFRAALMIERNESLTETYTRFHDPDERDPANERLRELHAAMDRAVLDAYGWIDPHPTCEFLLDHEDDEDAQDSRRKKPLRYRWPDTIRDEVLARLLELNAQRAAAELALPPPPRSRPAGAKVRQRPHASPPRPSIPPHPAKSTASCLGRSRAKTSPPRSTEVRIRTPDSRKLARP